VRGWTVVSGGSHGESQMSSVGGWMRDTKGGRCLEESVDADALLGGVGCAVSSVLGGTVGVDRHVDFIADPGTHRHGTSLER